MVSPELTIRTGNEPCACFLAFTYKRSNRLQSICGHSVSKAFCCEVSTWLESPEVAFAFSLGVCSHLQSASFRAAILLGGSLGQLHPHNRGSMEGTGLMHRPSGSSSKAIMTVISGRLRRIIRPVVNNLVLVLSFILKIGKPAG